MILARHADQHIRDTVVKIIDELCESRGKDMTIPALRLRIIRRIFSDLGFKSWEMFIRIKHLLVNVTQVSISINVDETHTLVISHRHTLWERREYAWFDNGEKTIGCSL